MKIFKIQCGALLVVGAAVMSGCSGEDSGSGAGAGGAKIYEVRGLVRGVEPAESTLVVEHEDIAGLMPAMTMPFRAKHARDIEGVKAGDAIAFEWAVSGEESWIQRLRPIERASLRLAEPPPAARAPVSTAHRLKVGDALPDFELTDQQGRVIGPGSFQGKTLVLTFIFTRCAAPKYCPLMSSNFQQLEKKIHAAGDLAAHTRLLSISFDPEYDTPEVLAKYAEIHAQDGDFWRFASGTPDAVARLTRVFAVYTEDEAGTINHGLSTALVDAQGVIRQIWRGNSWTPDEVMAVIEDSVGSSAVAPPA